MLYKFSIATTLLRRVVSRVNINPDLLGLALIETLLAVGNREINLGLELIYKIKRPTMVFYLKSLIFKHINVLLKSANY